MNLPGVDYSIGGYLVSFLRNNKEAGVFARI